MFGETLATFGLPSPVEAFRIGPDGAMPGQLGHAREGIRAGAGRAAGWGGGGVGAASALSAGSFRMG
jgi:hypothetical protein